MASSMEMRCTSADQPMLNMYRILNIIGIPPKVQEATSSLILPQGRDIVAMKQKIRVAKLSDFRAVACVSEIQDWG